MSKRRKQKQQAESRSRREMVFLLALVVLLPGAIWLALDEGDSRPVPADKASGPEPDDVVYAKYGGSESCRECHREEFELWSRSHHALAERDLELELDKAAFDPPRELKGAEESSFFLRTNRCFIRAPDASGLIREFPIERVLGVDPLRQFLVPADGGRWQLTQTAFDPQKMEWFDVFNDGRKAGEWGHWTGRGMNWNSMCASCHNTRVRKNYDPAGDRYATRMAERGVGCESCHGPMQNHVSWQRQNPKVKGDPTLKPVSRDAMLSTCGSCHARRSELTGDYIAGEAFFDHYSLSIPDETDLFHADGQVRDEDFEFTAFLGSKMHAAGVRCGDCHQPHSGKVLATDNSLCMRCHAGVPPAPRIDPVAHSRHKEGSPGNLCVECHMPHTTYMQRHARRDHGFTLPDPFLTKKHGIPNACNRCHKEKTVEWAVNAFEEWYGSETNRPTRARAETVAQARAGGAEAVRELMKLATEEKIPLWRAAAAQLLKPWSHSPEVARILIERTYDPAPIVRGMAARALEEMGPSYTPAIQGALERLLTDQSRSVRVEAAWALRATVSTNSEAGKDLLRWLEQSRDQPGGLVNLARFQEERGRSGEAVETLKVAVSWDKKSGAIQQVLANALARQGRVPEAVVHLQKAVELEPRDASGHYQLALALNELGQLQKAISELERAVELNPGFSAAWYNLGLAYSAADQPDRAVEVLLRAETLDPTSARVPYARATVLARLNQFEEALSAVRRTLQIDPTHREALELSDWLSRR